MDAVTGVGIKATSQESIHHSDKEVDPDFDPKDSMIIDSSGPTQLRKRKMYLKIVIQMQMKLFTKVQK